MPAEQDVYPGTPTPEWDAAREKTTEWVNGDATVEDVVRCIADALFADDPFDEGD